MTEQQSATYEQTRTTNGVTTYAYSSVPADFPASELLAILAKEVRRACRGGAHGVVKHGRDIARQMDRLAVKKGEWTYA